MLLGYSNFDGWVGHMITTAFDTETALITPGTLAPPLTCMTTFNGTNAGIFDVSTTCEYFVEILKHCVVGHNVAYDLAVLCAEYPDLTPLVFDALDADKITDTMIRQRLIDISEGQLEGFSFNAFEKKMVRHEYSLAALARRHRGIVLNKDEHRLEFGPLRDVPISAWPPGAAGYAKRDAEMTYMVWENQEAWADVLSDQYRQTRAAFALHLTSCWGMITDAEAITIFKAATEEAYEKARDICLDAGFLRANGTRDTKEAKARMVDVCTSLGLEPNRTEAYDKNPEKAESDPLFGVSLDEEACLRTGDPELKAYSEISSLATVVNDHVPNLLNGTLAPIQPRFQVLVDTGRTSCKGHTKGNTSSYGYQIQNVRRLPGIRECFIPRPGFVYVDADYTGLELHTWAQVCYTLLGHSAMGEALNQGKDPHLMIAGQILGREYSDLVENKSEPEVKEARQFGKIGNFGLMGGMGASTFRQWAAASYNTIMSEEFAEGLKKAWLETWPEAPEYFKLVTRLLNEGGGEAHVRHLRSDRARGPLRFTQTANTFFQGLGADAAKDALYEVVKATQVGTLQGCHVVGFVHDEILMEAPEKSAHEAAEILSQIMVDTAYKWLPDVKPKVDAVLMRRWSKNAKRLTDDTGRMIPWQQT